MAGKDIPLYDRSVSPPSWMTLAGMFAAALMLGCSGQHPALGEAALTKVAAGNVLLSKVVERPRAPVADTQPARLVDRHVVQAAHVVDAAEEPVFRSSRRIVPLPLVDAGPANSASKLARTPTKPKGDQRLFTAPPAPELTGRTIVPAQPEVVAAPTTVPSIERKSLPSLPPVDEQLSPLTAVGQRAERRLRYASRLAQRGAVYSAREEFVHVLGVMAQSLDNVEGGQEHRQALDAGLMALEEADAFAPNGTLPSVSLDLKQIVAGHQTPVLKDADFEKITPLVALQRYYAYAQERLAAAGEHEPVVSRTLYRMGRLQMVMSGGLNGRRTLGGPKAMALYKAALKVDSKNYIAANQLGVLLARYGQPEEARRVLMHSMSVSPQPETYHNLAVVHRTLGNDEASRQAQAQYQQQLAVAEQRRKERRAGGVVDENTQVNWVSAAAFTRMPNADAAEPLRPAPSMAGPTDVPIIAQSKPVSTESNKNKDVAKKGYDRFKSFFLR